jgi:hypothetical protein
LKQEDFDYREWVALQWIRNYILFEGDMPDSKLVGEFKRLYSKKEQVRIFALVKMMLFSNMLSNSLIKETFKEGAVCNI